MKRSWCLFIAATLSAFGLAQTAKAQSAETKHDVEVGTGSVQTEPESEETETQTPDEKTPPPLTTAPPPAYVQPENQINTVPAPSRMIIVADTEPDLVTPFGMELTLGGGIRGFAESDARSMVDDGGAWDVRVLFGSRKMLGFEAAYVGSASRIHALGLDTDATIMSHGLEGALRVNFLTGEWQPYILGGAGWARYSLVNTNVNTADLAASDDVAQFPIGAGLAFRYEGFVLDARGVYRPTAEAEILERDDGNMPTWQADLTAGVEF